MKARVEAMTDLLKQARELREKLQKRQAKTGDVVLSREGFLISSAGLESFLDAVIPILECAQDNEELIASYRRRAEKWLDEPSTQQQQRTHTLGIMATILATSASPNNKLFDSIAAAELMLAEVEKRK